MTNIQLFDLSALYVSYMLYRNFPKCIDINLYEEMEKEHFINASFKEDEKLTIVSETIFWLYENDFLAFSTPEKRLPLRNNDAHPIFTSVRLTAKGLAVLKSTPKSISDKESFGDKITTAVSQQAISKLTELGTDLAIKLAGNFMGQ